MRIGSDAELEIESSLIRQIRADENVSRVDLARRLDLARSTIGQYVDRLIDDGFIREGRKTMQPAGRPPTVLELVPEAGYFAGVDFEGRQVLATAVDFAQRPLRQFRATIRQSESADRVVERIAEAVDALSESSSELLGIGIGVPGVVDTVRGVGLHYKFIRGWQDIPLGDRLSRRFQVPIYLDNNIRVMALAEQLFGQGRGVSDFVCLGIRSGIGAGVVVDGRLHSGPKNLAGEIGGWPCDRGRALEQNASLTAMAEDLAEAIRGGEHSVLALKQNRVQLEDLLQAAREGDGLVCDVLWRAGRVVGTVIAQLNLLLNPEKVIVAGPLASLEREFMQAIREAINPLSQPPHASAPEVVGSKLGEFGGALGGAALAVQRWVPTRSAD